MSEQLENISEIIEMAWCDKTSFDDIQSHTRLSESKVIRLMRKNLKPSSFRLWRKRVSGRTSKHKNIKRDV
ncbi:MAG: TIGR03643 family protein [Pseudomonadota bacterium]|nr:TIGR03643 family protein [Pseudomonadota bacterium]